MIEVEGGLSLQQDDGDREQPVGDATEGTTVRAAACTQGILATAVFGIVLHGHAGPVEHGLAQADLHRVTHHDEMGFAAALGHECHAG